MDKMCPSKEVLALLASGNVPENEVRTLIEHIRTCERCASIYKQFLATRSLIKHLSAKEPPQGSMQRTVKSTQERLQVLLRRRNVVNSLFKRIAACAAIAATILIALIIVENMGREPTTPSPISSDKGETVVPKPVKGGKVEVVENPVEPVQPASVKHKESVPELSVTPVKTAEHSEGSGTPAVEPKPTTAETHRELPPLPPLPPLTRRDDEEPPLPSLTQVLARFAELEKKDDISGQIEQLHIAAKLRARDFLSSVALNKSYSVSLRQEALVALAEIGDKQSVEVILQTASDVDWYLGNISVPKALSVVSDEETVEWLLKDVFAHSSLKAVKVAIAKALGYVQAPVPYDVLTKSLKREADPLVRFLIAESLGHRTEKGALAVLEMFLKDKEWFVRDIAVEGIARLSEDAAPKLLKILSEERSPFVVETIVKALANFRSEESIKLLVSLLRTSDRRLFGETLCALTKITGKVFKTEVEWRNWFSKTGGKIERPSDEIVVPADFYFMDIPFYTKSIVFVVDCSRPMHNTSRVELALKEVEKTVSSLPEFVLFNIICFDTYARFFSHSGLVYASHENKAKALEFLKAQRIPQFASSLLYDSIEKALELSPDDIVLVSAGLASAGKFTQFERILFEIYYQNIFKKSRIHTVGLFATTHKDTEKVVPVGPTVDLLKNLASQNHGIFIWRWVTVKNGNEK